MMEKMIITIAITGSLTTREQNQNIPYTPEEIASAAVESYEAGASVVHLHVRDPLTGKPAHDAELFSKAIKLIRERCNLVINTTTGGAPGMSFDERISVIPKLASDKDVKPDLASLNCGSINFGVLSRKKGKFVFHAVQMNPWPEMLRFAETMKRYMVKPECEIFEAGMINNAKVLHEIGAIDAPLHFQFVLGVLGGMQATVENLLFLKNSIPSGSTWSVCAVGLDIFSLGPVAIASGGHVRVGFEDCVYIAKGSLAESNAQMVRKIAGIAKEMGRDIATPEDARSILSLN